MENKYNGYYYGNTTKLDHNRTDKFIEENKDKKLWSLALFYDNDRRVKHQRKYSFWEGYKNDFATCKTSDLTKYDGLFTFEEAFKLAQEFPLKDTEVLRINFDMKHYDGYDCLNHFILIRSNIGDI